MSKFKVNQSVYIKHQGANPWRIVQIDNPECGDHALYHLRDSRNTYEREFGYNLIGTDEPDASARAHNNIVSLEELLRKSGISQQEFQKMRGEMQRKGASAVHFIRGKDGRLVYKADGTTISNEKVRIGDTAFGGAATTTLDFAKDRRGDYILAGDEVISDAGDGIDTYEVLKVLPGNRVKLGGLGVEVATVDAKSVSAARKHGILKRDGDTVVLKNVALNAAYSKTLEYIMSSVRPYMDKRIKGDESWKYPMLVITVLRKVCDKAVMSAGRYDSGRPRHRIYGIDCEKDGWKFSGNLIITGLLHRDDPDDVSTFDEYDMTLSLMNVGKATNSTNPVVANALAARNAQHFHGEADALAQKIALQYNKWADAPDGRKDGEFSKLNTLIRTASSLGGGVWVMRDGTIAIAQNQPRGAKRIQEFL